MQIDVKFVEPLTTTAASNSTSAPAGSSAGGQARSGRRGKYYQFTAIDDCTRLRVLRIYPQLNQKTAIQFVDYGSHLMVVCSPLIKTDSRRRAFAMLNHGLPANVS